MMEKFTGQILLVTGAQGSGKTMLCRRVVDLARKANWQVRGLISPPILKGDEKVGIGVEDLNTGKRYMLARLPDENDANAEIRSKGWVFDSRCVTWCNSILEQSTPCDLLVIDEIGPLELVQNTGWMSAFPVVDGGKFHLALVVVREEFLDTIRQRWPKTSTIAVSNVERIDNIVENVIDILMANQGITEEDIE